MILLLISPDFMASDYCYQKEMTRALERQELGEAIVAPVMLRATDIQDGVLRGGSFLSYGRFVRSVYRPGVEPDARHQQVGFRVALGRGASE